METWLINPIFWLTLISALVASISGVLAIGIWVGRVNSDRAIIKEFIKEVRKEFKEIKEVIYRATGKTVKASSPRTLTDLGKHVSEEFNAKKVVSVLSSTLKNNINEMLPYEIEEYCFKHIREEFKPSKEQDMLIKSIAYNNGISYDEVLMVLAIEMRDMMLGLAKEIRNSSKKV